MLQLLRFWFFFLILDLLLSNDLMMLTFQGTCNLISKLFSTHVVERHVQLFLRKFLVNFSLYQCFLVHRAVISLFHTEIFERVFFSQTCVLTIVLGERVCGRCLWTPTVLLDPLLSSAHPGLEVSLCFCPLTAVSHGLSFSGLHFHLTPSCLLLFFAILTLQLHLSHGIDFLEQWFWTLTAH